MSKASEVIDKIKPTGFISQERFANICDEYMKACQSLPEEEFSFHSNTCYGGNCYYCGKPWVKRETKNRTADYTDYRPDCDCHKNKEKAEETKGKYDRLYLDAEIPAAYIRKGFENLDHTEIKPATSKSIQTALMYARDQEFATRGCVYHGKVGTGKTHVAIAVLKKIIEYFEEPGLTLFVPVVDLVERIINDEKSYMKKIKGKSYVVFDDLDKLAIEKAGQKNQWISEKIFSLIDSMMREGKRIFITSNYETVEQFREKFDQSIASRIVEGCKFISFDGLDYRMIKALKE